MDESLVAKNNCPRVYVKYLNNLPLLSYPSTLAKRRLNRGYFPGHFLNSFSPCFSMLHFKGIL